MNSYSFLKSFIFGSAAGIVVLLAGVGCANMQQNIKTAKDAVKLAQDACVIIRDVAPDNKEEMEVCAKEEELRPYIKLILGGRARANVADPGAAGSAKAPATK